MTIVKTEIPKRIYNFLKKNNVYYKKIETIKNDASKRIYYRILNESKNTIIMDSSLEKKSLSNFIFVSNFLKKNYSVPNIYVKDISKGILHIEDFGKNKYSKIFLNNRNKKLYYYKCAIDLLINLSKVRPPNALNYYGENVLYKELNLFLNWYLKANFNINKKQIIEWDSLWKELFEKIKYKNDCLVLRDFHVDNIFYLENRKNLKKIGLIDYQDAIIGHAAYDLVSLIQDVRVYISFKDQKKLFDYYIKKRRINEKNFENAYLILGTQRLFKIIGIFNRLNLKYRKPYYLTYLPRTWKLLKRNMGCPIFFDLNKWFKKNNFLKYE